MLILKNLSILKVVKSQILNLLKTNCKRENNSRLKDSYWAMVTHDMKGPGSG